MPSPACFFIVALTGEYFTQKRGGIGGCGKPVVFVKIFKSANTCRQNLPKTLGKGVPGGVEIAVEMLLLYR